MNSRCYRETAEVAKEPHQINENLENENLEKTSFASAASRRSGDRRMCEVLAIVFDASGRIVKLSRAFEEATGRSLDYGKETSIWDLLYPGETEIMRTLALRTWPKGTSQRDSRHL
jgi:PAS domain-containing protein